MKSRVLIICFSALERDPRVRRQVHALRNNYFIITAGYSNTGFEDEFIEFKRSENKPAHWKYPPLLRKTISLYLKIREKFISYTGDKQFEIGYWNEHNKSAFRQLKNTDADLIIANDLNILPVAVRTAKSLGAKLIFDAHEYYPLEFENNIDWMKGVKPMYDYLCKMYLNKADYLTIVSETIAKKYVQEFAVKHFCVIDNAGEYRNLIPGPVSREKIKLVHHGFAIPERKIENLINVLNELDNRFELHLILVHNIQNENYYMELKELNKNNERLFFHEPVPFQEIPGFINQFDIGVHFWDTSNFNNYSTIPNKFYEFIQARLMLAICPSAELEKIVDKYELGIYTNEYNYNELAQKLNAISSDDVFQYKKNAHKHASELSSQKNSLTILETVNSLIKRNA